MHFLVDMDAHGVHIAPTNTEQPPMPAYIIETDVPLPYSQSPNPERAAALDALTALSKAAIGASVFIPFAAYEVGGQLSSRLNLIGGRGWASIRKTSLGFRVWKVADPAKPQRPARANSEPRDGSRVHLRGFASMDPDRR